MKRLLPIIVVLSALMGTGCRPSNEIGLKPLELVPKASLEELEVVVRDQIEAQRAKLDAATASRGETEEELADVYGDLGLLYHAYDLLVPAAACYRNAILLDPEENHWRYYLSHVMLAEGDLEAAETAFREALTYSSDDIPTLLWLAEVLWQRGILEEMERILQHALTIAPENSPVLFRLGQLAAERDRHAEAVDLYEKALSAQPWASSVRYPLAAAYRELGDEVMVKKQLELRGQVPIGISDPLLQILQEIKKGSRTFLVSGATAMENGRYEEAVSNFRMAVESDPGDDLTRLNLGAALTALGRAAEAEEHLRFAADEGRTAAVRSKAWFNLGVNTLATGELLAAIEEFDRAVEIDESNQLAREHLAGTHHGLGNYEAALKHYALILDGDPLNATAHISAASCHFRLQREADALQQLETAHRLLPDDDAVADRLAQLLATAADPAVRDHSRALEIAIQLYTEEPTPRRTVTLAMAQAGVGDLNDAIDFLTRAREALGNRGPAWLAEKIERDIESYRAGRPCREPLL